MSNALRSSLIAAALFAVAAPVHAQTTDARWEAWYGCWKPAGPSLTQSAVVCVAPVAQEGVEIMTLRGDTVVSHDTVVADGVHHTIARQGCTGWQRAQWSEDARRVYLHSDLNCGQDLGRTTDGMLAFSPNGDWLDIQALQAFGSSAVRVVRYQDAGTSVRLPAEVAAAIGDRGLQLSTKRHALGATVTDNDVIDVARHADSTVATAWVSTRGEPFSLDGKSLVALANAGVPGGVTDVMLALSYPKELAIQTEGPMIATAADSSRVAAAYMRSRYADTLGFYPFGWGPRYGFGYGYGYGPYGEDGYCPGFADLYGPYDYGFGRYGYGGCGSYYNAGYAGLYGLYGYGYGGYPFGGFYYPTGVLVGTTVVTPHGVAVKGRGYTKSGEATSATPKGAYDAGGTARRSTASPDGYSGSSSGSSRSSGGSSSSAGTAHSTGSSGGGSSSSGSTGRTAHPKP